MLKPSKEFLEGSPTAICGLSEQYRIGDAYAFRQSIQQPQRSTGR